MTEDGKKVELFIGDHVLVCPPRHRNDEHNRWADAAKRAETFSEEAIPPETLGFTVARISSLTVIQAGLLMPGWVTVHFLGVPTGSLRQENVLASDCVCVLRSDGSRTGLI